ncbi:lysozyme inhibitor LprI family protein [Cupriavidus sp. CuC1]|uniref:lysozyme inhibitor LprI family protein n=1 Tax=Cupriavidus sp. CuC1 TaxID=3373131 RepID=UPI0037CD4F06
MRFLPARFAVAAIAAVLPPAIALAASAVPDCQTDALWRFDAACLATTRSDLDQQQANALAALRQAADPRRRELLASAQAAWTSYRQAQCESEADLARAMHADDGAKRTMAPSDRLRCEVRLSEARLMELQAFAKRASR